MMIKRYLLFGYDEESRNGGWNDFLTSFDTIFEAKAYINSPIDKMKVEHVVDNYQLIDKETGKDCL